jgi:hypothetical protein
MKVFDYRIAECFDFDAMSTYYTIQKYSVSQQEYVLYSPKRFPEFMQAKAAINMLRKYKEPIYHYIE